MVEADGSDPEAAFSGIIVGYDGNNAAKTKGIILRNNHCVIDETVKWGTEPSYDESTGVTSAEGWGLTSETYTHGSYGVNAVQFVAGVNEYQYETLEDAIAAAQTGDTITLLRDMTGQSTIEVPAESSIILDLNGKTLTGVSGLYTALINYGTLTVLDSAGGGKLVSPGYVAIGAGDE